MPDNIDDLSTYADLAARLIDLKIDPVHQPGVLENLARIDALARVVLEFPLADEVEPAPRFEP